ncbi:MAG: thioether cross-link-forming SCIFF peptide maturase [Clostridia bacterium]|nr:MAG: thioether cross-link-forming SCIFF peptide maturase [Clostridia bacterium]
MEVPWDTGPAWHRNLHVFNYRGRYILVDVNSGAVHLLDEVAAAVVAALRQAEGDVRRAFALCGQAMGTEAFAGVVKELADLYRAGSLLAPDPEARAGQAPAPLLKALCLHVAHDCNLRCRYCFAGTGRFGGQRQLMAAATGRLAIDFLVRASGGQRFLEIDFFGGEPLLNFTVVKELTAYARTRAAEAGKEISFTLTTNGLLLEPEAEDFLNREGFQVVLSLDGRAEVHDHMRPLAGGGGSYAAVLPRMQRLVRSRRGENYYIRGTYTGWNQDFTRDVRAILEAGFRRLSLEPVVAPAGVPYALKPELVQTLCQEYDRLVDLYLEYRQGGNPFLFFHFQVDLTQGPCLAKRLAGCGAGHQYLAVTPAGDLYPCHQLVHEPEFYLGSVSRGILFPERQEAFRRVNVLEQEPCRECWARFYCGGGCRANAWHVTGEIGWPDPLGCELEKKRLECAIYLQVCDLL